MEKDYVILVSPDDLEIGIMEKMEAHEKGMLHRAFSVLIFNSNGEMLLQKRAFDKYHSGGLWTNSCCSHPRAGEALEFAAMRRMKEELGFTCTVQNQFSFIYQVKLDNDLTEHELDHVLFGISDVIDFTPNPLEVSKTKWLNLNQLTIDMNKNPASYTPWFHIIMKENNSKISHFLENMSTSSVKSSF